jgi:hypothetical protein
MQNNFIIRNHEDYLRAHITVLRRNPQKTGSATGSKTQPDTKSTRCKSSRANGSRQAAKLMSFPINRVIP